MSHRGLLRLFAVLFAAACVLIPVGTALADSNAGDVWVDNVGQPPGPGNEMDPHLACQDINLWGEGLADSSGSYTIDGWPPSGSQEQDYASTWSYNQSQGGTQVLDVISVQTLIDTAIANGDTPQSSQGFHFKLEFSQDPQKNKTFWVNCQIPTIVTTAASAQVGQPIYDVATLSGGDSPTGTITWNVYSSSDTSCKTSLGTVTDSVSGDGTYTSPGFTPSAPGGYQWVATYSGDSQNLSVSTSCNDPNEQSTVSPASPAIVTSAVSGTIGQPIHDVATLSGGDSPTGTITWNVYVAGTGCATSVDMVSVPVSGDGTYTSPDFTPSAPGSYQWVATYSGDANNNPVATSCNDPNEQSTVLKASPAIVTAAVSGTLGQPIHDVATLSGGDSPTGTITWNVYSSSDTSCKTSLATVTDSVSGDGTYTSPDFTPNAAGGYQWVATYSGDGNNNPVSTSCNDPNEQSTVSPASPAIVTSAVSGTTGQPIHDVATLSGGDSPTGTITWNVYSSSDTSCKTSLGTVTDSVSGDGTYTSPDFTPSAPGGYQWVATYSGDGNNNPVSTSCNDPNEQSTVSQATPAIVTSAVSGTLGQPIHDVATLSGGDSPTGTITWNVYVAGTGCATSVDMVSVPVSGDGTYTSPDFTPTAAGGYEWVATYSGDGNNNPVATSCNDPNEQSTVQSAPSPGIKVVKLQRDGSSGAFTTSTIQAKVGDTIEYEIQVTNTGNTPLTLSLNDPLCNAGTVQGPFPVSGTLVGNVLSPNGVAQYTCSHVLTSTDASPFTNTATVTGQPPTGPPVQGTASVTATKQAVSAAKKPLRCGPHKVKKTKKVHGKRVTVCVRKKRAVVIHRHVKPPNFTG